MKSIPHTEMISKHNGGFDVYDRTDGKRKYH